MEIQEYKNLITENRIKYLKQRDNLIEAYIKEHVAFKVGDKVHCELYSKKYVFGFIQKIFLGYDNNITYSVYACKKDGTPSKKKLFFKSIKRD